MVTLANYPDEERMKEAMRLADVVIDCAEVGMTRGDMDEVIDATLKEWYAKPRSENG